MTSLLLVAAFTGCSSHKSVPTPGETEIAKSSLGQRLAAVDASLRPWQSVKMPISLKLNSPAKISLSGTVAMSHGHSIVMSLRFMGFVEVATLAFTPDSVLLIDKYHKLYFKESTTALLSGLNLSINDVQALILGRPFVLQANDLTSIRPDLAPGPDNTWRLTPASPYRDWGYSFIFDSDNLTQRALLLHSGAVKATIAYTDAVDNSPIGLLAPTADINISGRKPIEARIKLKPDRATWRDVSVMLPGPPGSDYRRVTLDQVAIMLKSI